MAALAYEDGEGRLSFDTDDEASTLTVMTHDALEEDASLVYATS